MAADLAGRRPRHIGGRCSGPVCPISRPASYGPGRDQQPRIIDQDGQVNGRMAAHPSLTLERTERNARILANLGDLQREHHEVTIDWLRRSGAGDHALQPGARAPDFLLPDERGRLVSSRELLAKGPLVVAFFCGNWCPFSIAELVDLDLVAGAPRVGGANVVVVTPETARFGLELKQRYNLNMPVLSDIGNVTGFQFGIIRGAARLCPRALPRPGSQPADAPRHERMDGSAAGDLRDRS